MTPEPRAHPLAIAIEADGTGSATFAWTEVVDRVLTELLRAVEASVDASVRSLGVRYVDADGRATDGPLPGGVVVVGFVAATPHAGGSTRARSHASRAAPRRP